MITFFTIPKTFKGPIGIIQKNALQSWKKIVPDGEVLVFGDDDGVKEAAQELRITHIQRVRKNSNGTPLLSNAFHKATSRAHHTILCYANADIIFLPDLLRGIEMVASTKKFLIVGRRKDVDVTQPLAFEGDWVLDLTSRPVALHGFSAIDYFIFPKTLQLTLPDFAVGRSGWDNWLIYAMRKKGIPVIDATEIITAFHQNHNYSHYAGGLKGTHYGEEARRNWELAGGVGHLMNIKGASLVLTKDGLKKPPIARRLYALAHLFPPTQRCIAWARNIKLKHTL